MLVKDITYLQILITEAYNKKIHRQAINFNAQVHLMLLNMVIQYKASTRTLSKYQDSISKINLLRNS